MNTRSTPILLPFLIVAFAMIAALAHAVPGSRADRLQRNYPVKPLAITELEGEIGAEAQFWGETIKTRNGGRTRYSNQFYQEYILGSAKGYIYHPRFILFSAQLRLGLAQYHLHRDGDGGSRTSSGNEELVGYDVDVDLFKKHPVSASFGAHRTEQLLMGLFVDRYLTTTEGYNGTIRWNGGNRRMDLSATHTKTTEDGVVSSGESVTDTLEYNFNHTYRNRMETDLQYRLQKMDRRFRADSFGNHTDQHTDLKTQDLLLTNRIDLGANRRSYLQSTFRYHKQDNHNDLTSYYGQERLQLQHSPDLRSYYLASFLRNELPQRNVDTYRAEAGIDHNLFKSLQNHLDVHGRRIDNGDLVENRYGATARTAYRKTTPLGILTAGYSRTIDRVERNGVSDTIDVRDESVTLDDHETHWLDREDVIAGSVTVTDKDNEETYVESFDFDLVQSGSRTGIRLLHGGRLEKGKTVLVSYSVRVERDLSYYPDEQDAYVRHDFDRIIPGLSVYARRHDLWARDVSDHFHTQPLEYADNIVGMRQSWRDFAFSSEYQDHMEGENGYDQWRNTLEGNHTLSTRIRMGWDVGTSHSDYDTHIGKKSERESDYHFAGAHLDGTMGRSGFWKLEGRWTQETGRTERQERGIIGRIGHTYRRLTVEAGGRFEQLDAYSTRQDRSQVFTRLTLKLGRRVAGSDTK